MLKRVQERVYPKLRDKLFKSDDELYLFLILQVATIFACSIHVLLFVMMAACRVPVLPWINLASVLIFTANFFLVTRRRTYLFSGLLITIEVTVYTFIASYIIGAGNYNVLYLLLVLVMQIIIPYSGWLPRSIMSLLLWVCSIIVVVYGHGGQAYHLLGGGEALAISVCNICITGVGIVVELLVGNTIRGVIAHYNEKRMQELTDQANTDPLTGLYNRRYADMMFAQLRGTADGRKWCVAILDIDDFKRVNDSYGHSVGDEVLRQLTGVMRKSLRKSDMIIRWGGEEFLILLGDVEPGRARVILDKVRRAVEESVFATSAGELQITVTIGVAKLDMEQVSQSVVLCDTMLYEGKRKGKNQVTARV